MGESGGRNCLSTRPSVSWRGVWFVGSDELIVKSDVHGYGVGCVVVALDGMGWSSGLRVC